MSRRKYNRVAENLSATINALEELKPCFIQQAINDAIAKQCEDQHLPPVKYGEGNFSDVLEELLDYDSALRSLSSPATFESQRLKRIPIIGTVGDEGIKLKPEYEEPSDEAIADAKREAQVVATFLEGGCPDFLMEATLSAIDDAFEYAGLPKPLAGPDAPAGPYADYDKDNLVPLFLRTRLTSWSDMWSNKDRVKDAVHTLLHNPKTPAGLWENVAEFVTETLNNKGNGDDLHHTAPMLTLILDLVPEDELMGARIEARGGVQ